ncbi:MAG: BMP family ABC transporter substrate-binding protein [Clostridia bacterium]|nr:BMP family ABC transporter substrate-binding protein [Clostridia bacterium]
MKRFLSLFLACLMVVAVALTMASCENEEPAGDGTGLPYGFEGTKELAAQGAVNGVAPEITGDVSKIKIGAILIGDANEGYTKAHIDGITQAAAQLGIQESQIVWKYSTPENEEVTTRGEQLIADGCNVVITNSYGHQTYTLELASKHPEVQFIAMTGDLAATSGLSNLSNAFTKVYESRYVAGVVAGMKLKELIDGGKLTDANYDGENVKIGYVGAFNFAEVMSGYTAFYLGVKSIVNNVVMDVHFTDSWYDFDKEKAAAASLVESGCVIISQHADSAGAPTAVEEAFNAGKTVYRVGYNVSMLDVAPNAALTSATNVWSAYYSYAFATAINGGKIATNWSAGYKEGAVKITELGSACAEGTQAKVDEVIAKLKSGELNVFDTSKFTVDGKTITWAYATDSDGDFAYDKNNVVADGYFHESYVQSAPAFNLKIDGIRWLNK